MANHPSRTKVVTWMATNGGATYAIDLTADQARSFEAAGVWPRCPAGPEYCEVSQGAHVGDPTWTDDEVAREIESLR